MIGRGIGLRFSDLGRKEGGWAGVEPARVPVPTREIPHPPLVIDRTRTCTQSGDTTSSTYAITSSSLPPTSMSAGVAVGAEGNEVGEIIRSAVCSAGNVMDVAVSAGATGAAGLADRVIAADDVLAIVGKLPLVGTGAGERGISLRSIERPAVEGLRDLIEAEVEDAAEQGGEGDGERVAEDVVAR